MSHYLNGSVTAKIGFSVDLDPHEKLLHRIGPISCQNHVESILYVFVSIHFFCFPFRMNFCPFKKTVSDITLRHCHLKSDLHIACKIGF